MATAPAILTRWPRHEDDLIEVQRALAGLRPPVWQPPPEPVVAGCFACLPRGGSGRGDAGDPVWAAAAAYQGARRLGHARARGTAAAAYQPGLLALRIGPALAAALRGLPPPARPDVVLVDATGRDHPRAAGLAVHLGAVLGLPTVGVTHRPLLARGEWPPDRQGATSPLLLDGDLVGYWLRTRAGRRPVAVHAGWRTSPETAVTVVAAMAKHRTPTPLREARRLARRFRATGGDPATAVVDPGRGLTAIRRAGARPPVRPGAS